MMNILEKFKMENNKKIQSYEMYNEVDYKIPQHVNRSIQEGNISVKVISADTDVSVLLCSLYNILNWSCSDVYMENFSPGKSIISIGRTVEQHHQIVPNLIGFHALTGCDSVPMFEIGKGKVLSAFKQTSLTEL